MTETMDPLVSIDLATRSLRRKKRDIWRTSEMYSSCQIQSAPSLRLYSREQHMRVHVKEDVITETLARMRTSNTGVVYRLKNNFEIFLSLFFSGCKLAKRLMIHCRNYLARLISFPKMSFIHIAPLNKIGICKWNVYTGYIIY